MSEVTLASPILESREDGPLRRALEATGALWGRLERKLFRRLYAGAAPDRGRIAAAKREWIARYGLSARQFNGMRLNLEGKIEAWREGRKQERERLKEALARLDRSLEKLRATRATLTRRMAACRSPHQDGNLQALADRRRRIAFRIHQKQRRRHALQHRLQALESALDGAPALCFGGRRLFRQQFQLGAHGFRTHGEWLRAWRKQRSAQFYAVGSKGEVQGNGECQFHPQRAHLRLRLPHALERRFGKRLEVAVDFYREADLLASLQQGRAISYRFRRREDGHWEVLASTPRDPLAIVTRREAGMVGADLNVDHIAVAELDRFGNLVRHRRIPLDIQALGEGRAKARVGEAVAELVLQAREAGKPLVIEALDFRKKKAALRELGRDQARRLSGFAFTRFQEGVASRCEREGVELLRVNPAFTSVIGFAKFGGYRISPHVAAAMAIARRAAGLGERLSARTASPRLGEGLQARLREIAQGRRPGEHVWKAWRALTPWLRKAMGRPWSAQGGGASHPGRDLSPPVTSRPSGSQGFRTPAIPAVGMAAPGTGRTKGPINPKLC